MKNKLKIIIFLFAFIIAGGFLGFTQNYAFAESDFYSADSFAVELEYDSSGTEGFILFDQFLEHGEGYEFSDFSIKSANFVYYADRESYILTGDDTSFLTITTPSSYTGNIFETIDDSEMPENAKSFGYNESSIFALFHTDFIGEIRFTYSVKFYEVEYPENPEVLENTITIAVIESNFLEDVEIYFELPSGDTNVLIIESNPFSTEYTLKVPVGFNLTREYLFSIAKLNLNGYENYGLVDSKNNEAVLLQKNNDLETAYPTEFSIRFDIEYAKKDAYGNLHPDILHSVTTYLNIVVERPFTSVELVPLLQNGDEAAKISDKYNIGKVDITSFETYFAFNFILKNQLGERIYSDILPWANFDIEISEDFTSADYNYNSDNACYNLNIFSSRWLEILGEHEIALVFEEGSITASSIVVVEFIYEVKPEILLKQDQITVIRNYLTYGNIAGKINDDARNNISSVTSGMGDEMGTSNVLIEIESGENWLSLSEFLSGFSATTSGTYNLRYSVEDNGNISDYAIASLILQNTEPIVNTVNFKNIYSYGSIISGSFSATDANNDPLIFDWDLEGKTGLSVNLNENGTFTITATTFTGTVSFSYWAEDILGQKSSSKTATFVFSYYDDTVPPVLTLIKNNDIIKKNKDYDLLANIDTVSDDYLDVSAEDVTFETISTNAENASIVNKKFIARISGTYTIRFTLSDGKNSTSKVLTLTVSNTPPQTVDKDLGNISYELKTGTVSGVDENEDELWYTSSEGILRDSVNVQIGTVVVNTNGSYTLYLTNSKYLGFAKFAFIAYDSEDMVSNASFVYMNFVDDIAPVVTENNLVKSFVLNRSYPGFNLTNYFTAVDFIDGEIAAEISGNNINFGVAGEYNYVFTFADKAGNQVVKNLTLKVVDGQSPEIIMVRLSDKIYVGEDFDIFDYISSIIDAEDGEITSGFKALYNEGVLEITGLIENTKKSGKYVIYLSYVDSDGLPSAAVVFNLEILEKPNYTWVIYISIIGAVAIIGIVISVRYLKFKRASRI